jgi:hypothetical protein
VNDSTSCFRYFTPCIPSHQRAQRLGRLAVQPQREHQADDAHPPERARRLRRRRAGRGRRRRHASPLWFPVRAAPACALHYDRAPPPCDGHDSRILSRCGAKHAGDSHWLGRGCMCGYRRRGLPEVAYRLQQRLVRVFLVTRRRRAEVLTPHETHS